MKINGITVCGTPGQGADRFRLEVPSVTRHPGYAQCHNLFSAAVIAKYDLNSGQAIVLMINGNCGASITNSADQLIPFIHRLHLGRRGIKWKDVRWLYRDSEGCWDEIVVTDWDGGNHAEISFRPLGNRSWDAVTAAALEAGFLMDDTHDNAHVMVAIRDAQRAA